MRKTTLPAADRLWSHAETAAYLNVSEATLHQWNYQKRGPRSFKVGRYRRYAPLAIEEWLNSRASDGGDAA